MRNVFVFIALLLGAMPAGAAEIKVLSTIALQGIFEELGPRFEKASGHKLNVTFGLGVPQAKRIQEGEAADLLIGPSFAVEGVMKAGKLRPDSGVALARSSVGIAIRRGARRPDISTPEALKRTLLAARSISYSNPAFGGASGVHFAKVIERLGIAAEMKGKTKYPPEGGFTAQLIATGEVELAVQQISELIAVPQAEVVGPLPGDLNSTTTFVAALPVVASQADAARALVKYLQSSEAVTLMKARGLEPAGESR